MKKKKETKDLKKGSKRQGKIKIVNENKILDIIKFNTPLGGLSVLRCIRYYGIARRTMPRIFKNFKKKKFSEFDYNYKRYKIQDKLLKMGAGKRLKSIFLGFLDSLLFKDI